MPTIRITRNVYLADRQGTKFADVVDDPSETFDAVLAFFNSADRQRRMEESELHHDRAALAGVVRELESQPAIDRFLGQGDSSRSMRLRQAIGVLVRMIMERRGWKKTGKKGSLGVRAPQSDGTPKHNCGGLAFWFVRAERYEPIDGALFRTVQQRCEQYQTAPRSKGTSKPRKRVREGASQ
ncbi:hypothetical protein [Blastopirellula retiformator]|uniref:Uncharacterized protein n=1 Tax=Blastopirellula retiformator TaxID=2527970 RepID=A0A5C5V931_9BACT|nr:hypothetical protein [Blastopirellula retiformator]TWT34359.1 hypothetical protein Enr8_17660 [Blastopirellula retiformator]